MATARTTRHRVLVVGAGFGGLAVARSLRRTEVDVTLVDQHNFHTFQPLLYQVATAGLSAEDVAHQIRGIVRVHGNVRFRMGRVSDFDLDRRRVLLDDGEALSYDSLVLAAGAVYGDYGIPGVLEHAFMLKSLHEAVDLRSHIIRQFEAAALDERASDEGRLTFAIAGAGPTGVEMAGALVELFAVVRKDYPELAGTRPRVVLIEPTGAVLPPYTPATRAYAERTLRRRGVEVRLETAVRRVAPEWIELGDGEVLSTRTLIWAAGVRAHPLTERLGVPLGPGGRVPVSAHLHLPDRPEVFVIGDAAGVLGDDGRPHPQVAQVAIQMGKHVGRTILERLRGSTSAPFRYRDRGQMAIIGRSAGVAELSRQLGGGRFGGFLGWLAWLFVHLIYLPGHQNRVNAMATWIYNFFTYDRHARLVLDRREQAAEAVRTATAPRPGAAGDGVGGDGTEVREPVFR
jgi:NADH:ubiquinone reductase (H+-translocating)